MERRKNTLLLVDDHAVMREGLRELFSREHDFTVVGDARNRAEALRQWEALKPDAILVDISLGQDNGLSLVSELRELAPKLKILVLSMHDEIVFAERALRCGANGYVMKDQHAQMILAALRRVMSGKTYVSEEVSERLFQSFAQTATPKRARSGLECLSDRELEILRLIGQGQQTKVIAARLGITTKTVETYRARIKEKLALKTASELTIAAVNWLRDGFLETKP
jgi:DNA-binding NarL/FixJ family response regulator